MTSVGVYIMIPTCQQEIMARNLSKLVPRLEIYQGKNEKTNLNFSKYNLGRT